MLYCFCPYERCYFVAGPTQVQLGDRMKVCRPNRYRRGHAGEYLDASNIFLFADAFAHELPVPFPQRFQLGIEHEVIINGMSFCKVQKECYR